MLKSLILKEVLNNLLNLRFTLAYFLCTFLLVGSSAIMLGEYLAEKDVYDVNKSAYDRRLTETNHMWGYIWGGKIVLRPPTPMRIFALGGEKDADLRASVAAEFSPYLYGDFKRNPLSNLFPSVDMVFIIGVIISLLIFVLTYDAVSGEREEGTLRVLLSCPIPRDQILVAKWLGGFASLIVPLVTSWLIVLLILVFTRDITLGVAEWGRIIGFFLLSTLYVGVVFSLSLMVSMFFRSSSSAVLALLLVWVVAIVALPAASTSIAYLLSRPDGVEKAAVDIRDIGVLRWGPFERENAKVFKERFGGRDWPELSPSERNDWQKWRGERTFQHIEGMVDSIIHVGQRSARNELAVAGLSRWIARFSPFGCFQNAAIELSGTGMQRRQTIRESLEEYSRKSTMHGLEYGRSGKPPHEFVAETAPRPSIRTIPLSSSLGAAMVDIGVLLCMGVLFFLGGYVAFMRMEVL
ncbi:MAG: ABC transporter permease subunit [Chitinivibrionales bacterium]|nr:ABC transporter permease subunit [Chitinivibrionales bacterium]